MWVMDLADFEDSGESSGQALEVIRTAWVESHRENN